MFILPRNVTRTRFKKTVDYRKKRMGHISSSTFLTIFLQVKILVTANYHGPVGINNLIMDIASDVSQKSHIVRVLFDAGGSSKISTNFQRISHLHPYNTSTSLLHAPTE